MKKQRNKSEECYYCHKKEHIQKDFWSKYPELRSREFGHQGLKKHEKKSISARR